MLEYLGTEAHMCNLLSNGLRTQYTHVSRNSQKELFFLGRIFNTSSLHSNLEEIGLGFEKEQTVVGNL